MPSATACHTCRHGARAMKGVQQEVSVPDMPESVRLSQPLCYNSNAYMGAFVYETVEDNSKPAQKPGSCRQTDRQTGGGREAISAPIGSAGWRNPKPPGFSFARLSLTPPPRLARDGSARHPGFRERVRVRVNQQKRCSYSLQETRKESPDKCNFTGRSWKRKGAVVSVITVVTSE
ncbi:hypothetical protein AOLI_G00318240 [Acnodon oligacanthus]